MSTRWKRYRPSWVRRPSGEALAAFECEAHARYDGGDHVILVGRVKRFTHLPDPERNGPKPLVYYRGRYGTVVDFTG
jgi:flavin reductase (DIM6/NTAB) family NADH-FMN oxidoreductase RutF